MKQAILALAILLMSLLFGCKQDGMEVIKVVEWTKNQTRSPFPAQIVLLLLFQPLDLTAVTTWTKSKTDSVKHGMNVVFPENGNGLK